MLRYHSYNIVFQEVPGEVTLAINLSNCPNRCKGCHSPYLQEDKGDVLSESVMDKLLIKYSAAITCVCFMGGDADPHEVNKLAGYIKKIKHTHLKTAWYSGKANFPDSCSIDNFNYLKVGAYVESRGGLDSPNTNQRFYRIENGELIDETTFFLKKR